MARGLTIGQLARSAGVRDSTIRFYERLGLVHPAGRTPSNYRYYADDAADRLAFIRAARAAGFELADIKALLDLQDGHTACREVRGLVDARLTGVRGRLRTLRQVERVLAAFQQACRTRRRRGCPVIESLAPRRHARRGR